MKCPYCNKNIQIIWGLTNVHLICNNCQDSNCNVNIFFTNDILVKTRFSTINYNVEVYPNTNKINILYGFQSDTDTKEIVTIAVEYDEKIDPLNVYGIVDRILKLKSFL